MFSQELENIEHFRDKMNNDELWEYATTLFEKQIDRIKKGYDAKSKTWQTLEQVWAETILHNDLSNIDLLELKKSTADRLKFINKEILKIDPFLKKAIEG